MKCAGASRWHVYSFLAGISSTTSSETQASPTKPQVKGAPKKETFGKGVVLGAAAMAGALYAIGGSVGDRYPIRVEYELAKACIDVGEARLSYETYLAKQERCLCTLEATMKKVDYKKYKKSISDFSSAFRELAPSCKSKGRS